MTSWTGRQFLKNPVSSLTPGFHVSAMIESPHTIQQTRQSPIMSNHEPIIPTINDQTTTIPVAPDREYPPNVPAVTHSQQSNVFFSQSTKQSHI